VNEGTVAVAIIDDGGWSACFGLSYRDLLMHDITGGRRIIPHGKEMRQLASRTNVASSRNKMVTGFLDTTACEWLWFVDVDMGFGPDSVDRLVKSADPVDRPVMGALCFALRRARTGDFYAEKTKTQPTIYEYLELDTEVGFRPILDYPRGEVIPVAGTGGACLLIHRSALESVRERYGDIWFEPITHPTGDRGKPRGFSEDLSFCVRLASLGIPVHVDTSVKTCHEKGGVFLDEEYFDMQQAQAAKEAIHA